MTAAVVNFSRFGGTRIPHLAFSFNFTSLPGKAQQARMREAFSHIDQFCVYTNFKAALYTETFGLDPTGYKSVNSTQFKPLIASRAIRHFPTPYAAAVGGEARDFETLIATALRLPAVHFVIIARPTALLANPPAKMSVLFNSPGCVCWQIASGATAVIVPLIGPETCCGHITLVSARLLALLIVITASQGTQKSTDGFKGTSVVPHADPDALVEAILAVRHDPSITRIRALADHQRAALLYNHNIWCDCIIYSLKRSYSTDQFIQEGLTKLVRIILEMRL